MPLLSAIGSKVYGFAADALRQILDSFTRTTTGSLGTSNSGSLWQAIRGVWYADGATAKSDDTATNNSIAAIQFSRPNASVSASVSGGTGLVFWLSDANSWWASTAYSDQSNYSCNCSTCYQTCSCASCGSCRDCQTVNTTCAVYGTCSGTYGSGYIRSGDQCVWYNNSSQVAGPAPCSKYNTTVQCGPYYACAGTYSCNPYSCNCQSCTATNYYLRLLKSESGTVSEATSKVSLASAAAAIFVQTIGDTITTKAYSDTAMTNQLGTTLTHTPTAPTKGNSVGIIKTESAYGQGSTVDDFVANIGD